MIAERRCPWCLLTRAERSQHFPAIDDYFLSETERGSAEMLEPRAERRVSRPGARVSGQGGEQSRRFIEDARVVVAIPEIQSDRQFTNSSFFRFYTAGDYTLAFSFLLVRPFVRSHR